ncbi:galectin-9C-like [Sceloporus undulatus]|uniref:galectin-9C-like n=1 Tax=Sceloporus undulatus TaxID=8520 RepID=UPI001C4B259C|nr:galectin-9C-like [Sceloporus undulatus]
MAFQTPYFTPSLPFTGHIYGGLRDGMMVLISGSVQHSCKRFQIDFQCGSAPSPRPDIAFHFNPRLDEGCVVGNTLERGTWQHEERKPEMPFRKGHPFEIRVLVNSISFKVAVNGKHFLEFRHRIPLSRVDTIGISGGVEVASINFQGPTQLPDIWNASTAAMTNSAFQPCPAFPPAFPVSPKIHLLSPVLTILGPIWKKDTNEVCWGFTSLKHILHNFLLHSFVTSYCVTHFLL